MLLPPRSDAGFVLITDVAYAAHAEFVVEEVTAHPLMATSSDSTSHILATGKVPQ